ncbi:putative F-box/kelch-repeat protein At3g22730 [Silene latifolia]|uniref:putative F-box/kelch-repeat protein At3g22730 n=1 Tax=Silene latifolia TaxID=37657 RepID=UPI003D77ACF4
MVEGYFDRLSYEILQNIALMLPFSSIIQLRCLSKFWYNLLTNPKFVDFHLSRALEKPPGYLFTTLPKLWPPEKNPCYFVEQLEDQLSTSKIFEYSFDCYEHEVYKTFQSSGGLMCAYSSYSCCFRIFNPDIAEEVQIPRDSKYTRSRFGSFIFGYSPSIKEYKILKVGDLQKKEENGRYCHLTVAEVCTLGSNIWRELQSVPATLNFWRHTNCQGNPFWMDSDDFLHFFDFVSEKFHVIPGPPSPPKLDNADWTDDNDPCVYFMDSYISMADTVGYVYNNRLWVLEDKIKGIWINKYDFSIMPLFCDLAEITGTLENGHLFGFVDGETKVFVDDMGCNGFRITDIEVDEDGVEEQPRHIEYMTPHVRSFVSPVRIMNMGNKFSSHKRKWVLDTLKLDCDATEVELFNRMYEFLQEYKKG